MQRSFLIHHLTLWQRVDDLGRISSDGRGQVYLHAAGCASHPLGQVRPDEHPNYKYTACTDKKYLFDMERYMKRKPAIVKPDEPFEMCELTAVGLK